MHVGLDLLFLVPGASGGRETYVRELVPALRATRPDLRLTAFLNTETASAVPDWLAAVDRAVVLRRVSASSRLAWAFGELVGVARAAARANVDVLHGTANFAPLAGPFARVLTLHDILFRRRPELLPPALRWGTEALIPPAARRATRVIAVSDSARDDIVDELGVARDRIAVVPNGVARPQRGNAAAAISRLGAGSRPVVISIATDLPHKNLGALVEGLALLEPERRPLLAFAGHGTDGGRLAAEARRLGVLSDVRLLGAVSQTELEDLYAAARGFITATHWEGFGIPVVEAMARRVPVACSNLAVLHEVAGDAAAFFDSMSAGEVATAIARLTAGGADVERRRAAGHERAARYTWTAAAKGTIAAYEHALSRHYAPARGPRRPLRASQ